MGAKIQNAPPVLIRSELNFMIKKLFMGEYKIINVLTICQKLKMLWYFEIFCYHRTTWGWKFQNPTPTILIRSEPNFMINKAAIR